MTDPRVAAHLATALKRGDAIVVNTGRGVAWVCDRVLAPLAGLLSTSGGARAIDLLVVGEKGGVWAEVDAARSGTRRVDVVPGRAVPRMLSEAVTSLVRHEFATSMFVDPSKLTMISVEMTDGLTVETYRPFQARFLRAVATLLSGRADADGWRVDATPTAVDIEHVSAGKDSGARRGVDWLSARSLRPSRAICVGDSPSDLAMADALHEAGMTVDMVFVGDRNSLPGRPRPYALRLPAGRNEAGTAHVLAEQLHDPAAQCPSGGRPAAKTDRSDSVPPVACHGSVANSKR